VADTYASGQSAINVLVFNAGRPGKVADRRQANLLTPAEPRTCHALGDSLCSLSGAAGGGSSKRRMLGDDENNVETRRSEPFGELLRHFRAARIPRMALHQEQPGDPGEYTARIKSGFVPLTGPKIASICEVNNRKMAMRLQPAITERSRRARQPR
jgi:hypothetical protein